MKLAIRISASALVLAAAIAGNSMTKTTTVAATQQATVPGPLPQCNPFTQTCPDIRTK